MEFTPPVINLLIVAPVLIVMAAGSLGMVIDLFTPDGKKGWAVWLAAIGLLEGFTHQGTLIYVNTQKQPVDELIECIYEMMQGEEEVQFGISKIRHDGFVLRCLGHGGEQLYDRFQSIQNLIWEESKVNVI